MMEAFFLRILVLPFIILALSFHEYAHAWTAYRLGDPTAARLGRLTLNPLAHIDWLGLLMIVLVGFGWAKPVPVNPMYFRNPPAHMAIVAAAGPISNFLFALVGAVFYSVALRANPALLPVIDTFIWLNVILGVFNLIPLPPLDGWRILQGINPSLYENTALEDRLQFVLLGLIILSILLPFFDILGMVIFPISRFIYGLIMGLVI